MQVRVDVTEDDLWRYARYALLRHPPMRSNIAIALVGSPVLTLVITLLTGLPVWLAIAAAVATAPLAAFLVMRSMKRQMLGSVADQRGVVGEHHIELSAAGLRERTAFNDTLTSWAAIHGIERHEEAVYVTLGPVSAHILPVRCFTSTAEVDAFVAEAERHLHAAGGRAGHR